MGKKVNHSDICLLACLRVYIRLEAWNIHVNSVCKSESAALHKVVHTHCSTHNLTAGSKVKNNILSHRNNLRIYALVSISLYVGHLAVSYNCKHRSGNLLLLNRGIDNLINS